MKARVAGEGRAIVIAGPTASGKSALALRLAEQLGGTVVNADSMQVYADLRLLTARPSDADMARTPHRLFGHVDAADPYSVGRWLCDAARVLSEAWVDGRVPVLVGGTGLYLKALTQGISAIPAVPEAIRQQVRREAENRTPQDLHARLTVLDPGMAERLRPSDPQRVLRALEVALATGRSLASFQGTRQPPLLPWSSITGLFLSLDRSALNGRIDRRFDAMIEGGALDEVRSLASRELDAALPAMRALGVPPLLHYLRGTLPLDAAVASGKQLTRHYAKRQYTFSRHQLQDLPWVAPDDAERSIVTRWRTSA